jgi:hypothetical protein
MAVNLQLDRLENATVDSQLYQSMLGSLMYTVIGTCPGISFAVNIRGVHGTLNSFSTFSQLRKFKDMLQLLSCNLSQLDSQLSKLASSDELGPHGWADQKKRTQVEKKLRHCERPYSHTACFSSW